MMFKHAIVRTPCPEMIDGITSASLGKPDYQQALQQHREYIAALKSLGLEVKVLEAKNKFPDSTFVEDVALCTSPVAIITSPGAPSRQGEQEEMGSVLKSYYDRIEHIEIPGTVEAGDIMMAGDHFYIGISDRTNEDGARQLISILEQYRLSGEMVEMRDLLHLKTGISYLEGNTVLVGEEFSKHPAFEKYQKIEVGQDEEYAANSLWVNGTILVPSGFPETLKNIEDAGYQTLTLDVSEFQKLDGGLSCLSLRF